MLSGPGRRRQRDGFGGGRRHHRPRARRARAAARPARREPRALPARAMRAHEGGYYLRLKVRDRPGAFAAIARRMAEAGISLDSIVQRNRPTGTAPRHGAPKRSSRSPSSRIRRPSRRCAARSAQHRGGRRGLRPAADDPHRSAVESAAGRMQDDREAMDRVLTLELVRVTERAAVAAAMVRGRGDEKLADQAAVDAMRDRAQPARRARPHRDRRGRARRGADALCRRGGRHRRGAGGRYRASIRWTGTTICAKNLPNSLVGDRGRHARRAAQRARRLHGEDRHRARLSRPAWSISTCRPTRRSGGSPRRRACSRAKFPPAFSTGRAMPG